MSHIPVFVTKRSRMAEGTMHPRRPVTQPSLRAEATTRSERVSTSGKSTSSLTIPRAPMASITNRRRLSAGRSPGALQLSTRNRAEEKPRLLTRKRTNSDRDENGLEDGSTSLEGQSSSFGRMNAIESRMTNMQDLFALERKRTEDILERERNERQAQESKVRQLEEDLLEQRRGAAHIAGTSSIYFGEDDIRQMKQQHALEVAQLREQVEREQMTVKSLKDSLSLQSTALLTSEATIIALKSQVSNHGASMSHLRKENEILRAEAREREEDLQQAETIRRRLHNEVQELRGNIRVFVRVRPSVPNDVSNGTQAMAGIRYPNEREASTIELLSSGESALGTVTMKSHNFSFDRVFGPAASQAEVFAEVAHLTQSVLDGYNTCIFAYGQTGSGKTHTLEGPIELALGPSLSGSAEDQAGIIPRAVRMLWESAEQYREKGWQYSFEGQMLEIYNESLQDLLAQGESLDGKYEVKHEKGRTNVSNARTVTLTGPSQVFTLLTQAKSRRRTASTLMNERSSRSHSIFTVRVKGSNATTMESCEAVLNLVDLAGSERLSNSGSGSNPLRLKEAQCINKSLSSLADVIAALQQLKLHPNGHVPYRNSLLTWLLKNSLGGNAKTLMLLTLSPMAEHLSESLCSLRFASKVNSTLEESVVLRENPMSLYYRDDRNLHSDKY